MVLIIAAKEVAALQLLLNKLSYEYRKQAIKLYEDNIPAMDLIKRPITDGRFKYIEIC